MGGSIIIKVLVYTNVFGSTVMSSTGFKINIGDSPNDLFEVYTPSGGSPVRFSNGLYTFWIFVS